MVVSYSNKIMFFKCLVLVASVLHFVQSASLSYSCNSTVLPPDPASGCCGIDSSGGKKTPIRQFPWLVRIEYKMNYDGSYKQVCNGALISGAFVLTTANCVSNSIENRMTLTSVLLGEYDLSNEFRSRDCVKQESGEECTPGAFRIPVESFTTHPQFMKGKTDNDIALIKLAKTVYYTDYVRPLCLPSSDITINPPENLNLVVAGWGVVQRNVDSKNVDTNTKRHINLPLWTSKRCTTLMIPRWPIINGEKQICAGGDGVSGTCRGDSGGPVMYEDDGVYQAVGIVSFGGAKCAEKNQPDVTTKVFAYKDWINQVMEK